MLIFFLLYSQTSALEHLGNADCRLPGANHVLVGTAEFGIRTITPLLMTVKHFEFVFCTAFGKMTLETF